MEEKNNTSTRLQNLEAVGGIVVNSDIFTRGHQHLIRYAAKRVKHLFIVVAEDDKSIFPFTDRLELIKAGTKDLTNVTVLPSGRFTVSSPTNDEMIFVEKIASALGITVCFAGEEPLDPITDQYNATMRRVLPQHGIDFKVIPRKKVSGVPISASRVRKLLFANNYKDIARLVPETMLEYLREKYGG